MTESELRRLKEQYLAERAEGESPGHWVQRAYPAWRPMLHFGVSVAIGQQIDP
jgi:sulfite reductase beta subunit-like hemoprotein